MDLWLDLDKTIWNCYDYNGNEIWAKEISKPSDYCRLQDGFYDWLYYNKFDKRHNIHFISSGAKKGVDFNAQPSVIVLMQLAIYDFFSNKVLEHFGFSKADYLAKLNNKDIIYIDDDEYQIKAARMNGIKSINRNEFASWKTFSIR